MRTGASSSTRSCQPFVTTAATQPCWRAGQRTMVYLVLPTRHMLPSPSSSAPSAQCIVPRSARHTSRAGPGRARLRARPPCVHGRHDLAAKGRSSCGDACRGAEAVSRSTATRPRRCDVRSLAVRIRGSLIGAAGISGPSSRLRSHASVSSDSASCATWPTYEGGAAWVLERLEACGVIPVVMPPKPRLPPTSEPRS